MTEQRGNDFVQSLERGLAVIRAFDGENPRLTLSDVSRRTGLTRAAARRFLLTLVELGYVHHDGRQFALRPRVLDLGFAYLSSMGLPEVAMPHMETLVATVEESSSMSVLDGESIVYIARVPTRHRIMTVSIAVGTRFPAYATSMGRVLLAGLSPADLDKLLANLDLHSYTAATVHDVDELRRILDVTRDTRLRRRRPGTGVRPALSGSAGARRHRLGDRCRQRVGARHAGDDRRHRATHRAPAARRRLADQRRRQFAGSPMSLAAPQRLIGRNED